MKAADLLAKAETESDSAFKVELENLARAYLRLAQQAGRNEQNDIVYETPPSKKGRDQA